MLWGLQRGVRHIFGSLQGRHHRQDRLRPPSGRTGKRLDAENRELFAHPERPVEVESVSARLATVAKCNLTRPSFQTLPGSLRESSPSTSM